MSVTQVEGLDAVFECQYHGVTLYDWAIDGVLALPSGIVAVSPSGGSLASLTIPAIPEYNNTVIQCRAAIDLEGGSFMGVLSDSATLTVYG